MVAAKRARLDKIVGTLREKEEEPEGKVLGDSSTGSLLFPLLFFLLLLYRTNSYLYLFVLPFFITFPLDESEEEDEKAKPMTKEEEDVDVLCSWMEVGGHPAHPEEEAKGLLAEVNAFLCFSHFTFLSLSLICLFATNSSLMILMFRLLLAFSSFFVGFETALPGK